MATPILTADPTSVSLTPGGSATVEVTATDPDAGTSTLTITGTDGQGNPAVVTVQIQSSDPIVSWSATVDDPDLLAAVLSSSGSAATVVVSWPNS